MDRHVFMLTKLYRQALFRHSLNETWQENVLLGIPQPIPDDYREMFEPSVDVNDAKFIWPPWIRTVDYLIADFEAHDLKRGLPSGTWIKEAEEWLTKHANDAPTSVSTPKPTDSGPVSPPLP